MRTYNRICIKNHTISDNTGKSQILERGKEYLTSDINDSGEVMVFSTYWVMFPVGLFAGAEVFTK